MPPTSTETRCLESYPGGGTERGNQAAKSDFPGVYLVHAVFHPLVLF